MQNITINNHGTVNIYESADPCIVEKAKDTLLSKLYFARYKQTLGGYEGWLKLLEMYHWGEYKQMHKFIKSCNGKGGKTRKDCLDCLEIIMKGAHK
jgi:hypothetical protein